MSGSSRFAELFKPRAA